VARDTLVAALQAIAELHCKKPQLDLSRFQPSIEEIAKSPNASLQTEAERTLKARGKE
jgi:hypothetical protein